MLFSYFLFVLISGMFFSLLYLRPSAFSLSSPLLHVSLMTTLSLYFKAGFSCNMLFSDFTFKLLGIHYFPWLFCSIFPSYAVLAELCYHQGRYVLCPRKISPTSALLSIPTITYSLLSWAFSVTFLLRRLSSVSAYYPNYVTTRTSTFYSKKKISPRSVLIITYSLFSWAFSVAFFLRMLSSTSAYYPNYVTIRTSLFHSRGKISPRSVWLMCLKGFPTTKYRVYFPLNPLLRNAFTPFYNSVEKRLPANSWEHRRREKRGGVMLIFRRWSLPLGFVITPSHSCAASASSSSLALPGFVASHLQAELVTP